MGAAPFFTTWLFLIKIIYQAGDCDIVTNVFVSLLVSPSIVSLLNTTVTAEGNTLTITCEATGYPLPTIVWSKVNGDLSSRVSVGENIANKLLSVRGTLTLTNVTKDDTGLYECSASNYLGSDADYVMITIQCKLHTAICIFSFSYMFTFCITT